jgi:hypothetical protein
MADDQAFDSSRDEQDGFQATGFPVFEPVCFSTVPLDRAMVKLSTGALFPFLKNQR